MKISTQVENILRDYPETRSSDKELTLKFWESQGLYLDRVQQERFKDMPATETIRRVRQKIQEEGRYQANDKVKKERNFKSMQLQQIAYKAGPAYIANTLEERL